VNPVQALLPLLVQSLAGTAAGQTFEVSVWARAVVDALMAKMVSRWPKDGERCPFTGLNCAQIYELSQPGPDGQPPIKTVSFAEPGENSGARFFLVGSALDYLHRLAERPPPAKRVKSRKQKN
jgi:hypothetical protein